jgi:hypothetical protein
MCFRVIPKEIKILNVQSTKSVIGDMLLTISAKPTKHKECNQWHLINSVSQTNTISNTDKCKYDHCLCTVTIQY